jgi:hypothetical protein
MTKTKLPSKLYVVTSYKPRSFVARFIIREDVVQAPSPVLRFMYGWSLEAVRIHCKMKGWSLRESKRE